MCVPVATQEEETGQPVMADLNDDKYDDRAAAATAETDSVAVEVVAWKNIWPTASSISPTSAA